MINDIELKHKFSERVRLLFNNFFMLNFSFALGLVFGFSFLLCLRIINECGLNSSVVRVYANELLVTSFASSCKVTVRLRLQRICKFVFFFPLEVVRDSVGR